MAAVSVRCNSLEIQSQDHLESRPTCGVSHVVFVRGTGRQDSRCSSTPIPRVYNKRKCVMVSLLKPYAKIFYVCIIKYFIARKSECICVGESIGASRNVSMSEGLARFKAEYGGKEWANGEGGTPLTTSLPSKTVSNCAGGRNSDFLFYRRAIVLYIFFIFSREVVATGEEGSPLHGTLTPETFLPLRQTNFHRVRFTHKSTALFQTYL